METKFKMAAITNFVGWHHKSHDSIHCNWNTWYYWLLCCYYWHGCHVNSLCQITERLLFFRISTEPPKRLLDHHIFWSHTSLVTSVVYSSASAHRTAPIAKDPRFLWALFNIALDKMLFFSIQKYWYFSYFSTKTYFVVLIRSTLPRCF